MLKKGQKPLLTIEEAYNFALRKISYRDYSQKDLEGKLRERNCPSDIIAQVVEKLKRYKYINEEDYAKGVYRRWLEKSYYGKGHLRIELMKKKVQSDLIPGILDSFSQETEEERALNFATTALRRNKKKYGPENEKARGNMARALATRGFNSDIIQKVLEKVGNED